MTRTSDLRVLVVNTLQSDAAVQAELGADGDVLPVDSVLGNDPDESDPRLLVDAEAVDSDRENKQEHKRFNVFLTAEATPSHVQTAGQNAVPRLLDAAIDVVTEHQGDRWVAGGVVDEQNSGFVEEVNRFRRIAQCRVERRDVHPAQTDD